MNASEERVRRWAERSERWVPDPLLLAILLTGVIVVTALVLGAFHVGPALGLGGVAGVWVKGLGSSVGLAFAFQMCLVLVTGHALACSPPAARVVRWLASLPRGQAQATMVVGVSALAAGVVHWGLAAVLGALVARGIADGFRRRGEAISLPLLGAAAYVGMAIWHAGLSGSAPLTVAQPLHFASEVVGQVPLSQTLFRFENIILLSVVALVLLAVLYGLARRSPDAVEEFAAGADDEEPPSGSTFKSEPGGVALEHAPWFGRSCAALMAVGLVYALMAEVVAFDLNAVNLGFLSFGLFLHGTLRAYMDAVTEGARGAGAILVQFPLYFGILEIMRAAGIVTWLSGLLVGLSSATTFLPLAFLSAGLVNFFVPSGGGQWAVQGPILLEAGLSVGVDPGWVILAFAYGDGWTNLLQPFWALPLLSLLRLRAADLVLYTFWLFLAMGAVVVTLLFLLPTIVS